MQHDIACFSKVGPKRGCDYNLEFASCQRLELTQAKIRRALVIMQAQEHIVLNIRGYYKRVTTSITRERSIWDNIELELKQCVEMMESHTREMKELMRSAESTRKLVHLTGLRKAIALQSRTLLIARSFLKFWIIATTIWSMKTGSL